jgi:autotransporter-associated beta strand protein
VISTPKNWKLLVGGTATDFLAGDIVLFNDSAVGTTSVNISDASVGTTSVTFNNSSKSYSISSTGGFGISSGYLAKSGSGSLTINTANTYAGGTTLNAGTLNVNNASALGTGTLTITGGTLDNTSATAIALSTNNVLNVNGDFAFTGTKDLNLGTGDVTLGGALGSRTITVAGGNLIVGSIPVATAGYGLTKAGSGTLSLSGTTTNRLDGTLNVTGTLETSQDLYATGLAGSGVIQPFLNANKWFYVTNNSDNTFSGAIQDGAGLIGLSKNGAGTLTLTGSNNYTLATNVNQGTLVFSGTTNNTNQGETVGSTAGMNGVLIISPAASFGANRNVDQFSSSITVGGNATSAGSIQLSATGAFNVAQQFALGTGTGGYAAYTQNGGTATIGSFMVVGFNNDRSVANIRDGSLTLGANLITIGAGGTGSVGVMNLTGGTVTSTATTGYAPTIGGVFVGENGTGVLNVSGGSLNLSGWGLRIAANTGSVGTVNLLGGTVTTTAASQGPGAGELNFNGGTLKASAANATFLEGLTNTYIYGGGAKIDDGGYEITVAQPLLAPTGNGVSAIGLTVSGGGLIDTPIVQITGDGTGASAVANIDAGGNLTGITMTNPGIGYSYASFTLLGGGVGNTGAIGGTPTIVANVSGGLTKKGTGTLTLTGELSYTGDTAVNAGTLTIAGTGILNTPSAKVTVFDGGTLNAASIVCNTLTIGGTPPPSSAASFTNANSVPEPSTMAMLILAELSLIGWTVRRCR